MKSIIRFVKDKEMSVPSKFTKPVDYFINVFFKGTTFMESQKRAMEEILS